MQTRFVPLFLLIAGTVTFASAQTDTKTEKEKAPKTKSNKEQNLIIRKKGDSKEKLTIVVDGDNITVNGKPLDEMKDSDIEVLRNQGITSLAPAIRKRMAPMGGMKMFVDGFPMGGNKALLGVTTEKDEKGAKINGVEKESAAEKSGLKKDDIITKVNEDPISNSEDLYKAVGKYKPEDKITITYLRDGKEATAAAILGKPRAADLHAFNLNGNNFRFEMPDMPGMRGMDMFNTHRPRLGLEIQDVEEGKGVKILDVDKDTPAGKAGLEKDDIITEAEGKVVESVDDLRARIREMKEGDSIKLTYKRAGKTGSTEVKIPRKLKTAEL